MSDDILKEALEAFKDCEECEKENREEALDDIKFSRLGKQWPDDILSEREAKGRPCLTINKLPAFLRQVINDARLNKPSINVHPVDSESDPKTAELISGLIRSIERNSDAEVAYDVALEHSVEGGFGYFRINVDYSHDDSFDMDIVIEPIINQFSVYGDPYSTKKDSSDWSYAFVVDNMKESVFKKKYRGADLRSFETDYMDLSAPWKEGNSIQIAEYWKREEVKKEILLLSDKTVVAADIFKEQQEIYQMLGLSVLNSRMVPGYKVIQYLISGKEILETNEWKGKYIPIIPVYGDEINIEGKTYRRGLIRDAKDPQRMFNYWRTVSVELGALAPKTPFIGPTGAFETDEHKWETANTENWAYIQYDGGIPPQRQPFGQVPTGALQESLNASDDMKAIIGIYDPSLGARSNETSGKAIIARQKESDVSNFHFVDNLSRSIRHAGRVIIDLIPHVYNSERVLRVLGPDDKAEPEEVRVNTSQPIRMKDGSEHIYDLTVGKYDVVVTQGPSFSTQREEAANQMMELLRTFPQAAQIIGDLVAKNFDWPGADEIAKRLKLMLPPQLQESENSDIPPEVMAKMQQMEQQRQQMEQVIQQGGQILEQQKQELDGLKADKSMEARKMEIEAYNAETNRLKAIIDSMTPEEKAVLYQQTLEQITNSPDILTQQTMG